MNFFWLKIKVFAALEMYLTLKIEGFRMKYSNSRNTMFACLLVGFIFICLNFQNKILNELEVKTPNKTSITNICLETKIDDELVLFYTTVN